MIEERYKKAYNILKKENKYLNKILIDINKIVNRESGIVIGFQDISKTPLAVEMCIKESKEQE